MTLRSNSKSLLVRALPLERLSVIQRDIRSYRSRWTKEKVIRLVNISAIEDFYTVFQHLNRVISTVGASLYLAGQIANNEIYSQSGGITVIICLYIDCLTSYYKEKIFNPTERNKKWDKLLCNTEDLQDSYQELAEILEPIRVDDSYPEKLSEAIKNLKIALKELIKKDDNGNLRELALLNDGPSESIGIEQRLGRFASSKRHLLENWKKWGEEWEERRNEQKRVKRLLKIVQRAVSKHLQGIAENEIEEEIKKKMLKVSELKPINKILTETSTLHDSKGWWQWFRNNCCGGAKDENEPSALKNQPILDDAKDVEIKEGSKLNEEKKEERRKFDLQIQEETQHAHIQILPK